MSLYLLPLMQFLIRYRRTAIGPLWLLVGPSLFIALLGFLYSEIGSTPPENFIPHLAIGLIVWTLISGFVLGSATIFRRGRTQIMQGGQTLGEIVFIDNAMTVLAFLHQVPIIVVVFLIYQVPLHWTALESLLGLAILIANGVWITQVFGIVGARYRDLSEIFQAVMRIAFLATPIIWMPGESGRGAVMSAFLTLNPFFHFLEVVRAPLLGTTVAPMSWAVVIVFTLVGFALAAFMRRRYSRFVPLWV